MIAANRRKNIIRLAVCAILVGFLSTTVISMHFLDSLLQRNSRYLTSLLSSNIFDAVRNAVVKPCMVARLISGDSFLVNQLRIEKSFDEDHMATTLSDYLAGIRRRIDFDSAFIVPAFGDHLFGINSKIKQLNHLRDLNDSAYDEFISSGRQSEAIIHPNPFNTDQSFFYIFSRIADNDGKVVGMCGIGLPKDALQEILRKYEQQYNIGIYLINWDGINMLSQKTSFSNMETINDLPPAFRQNREFAYVENEKGGYTITRYLNDIGWFLVVKGEKTEGENVFTHLIIANGVALIVLFLLLFLAMKFLLRSERTHIERQTFLDELTGIFNRSGFEAKLAEKFQKEDKAGALFIFDLDNFKKVNDAFGHSVGDALLKETAKNLQSLIRESDILARLGEDEFIAFFSDTQNMDDIHAKADSIQHTLTKQYILPDGNQLCVSASMGIAMYPSHGETYDLLFRNADKALYASQEGGGNRYSIYHT